MISHLLITQRAHEAFAWYLRQSALNDPVPTVIWGQDVNGVGDWDVYFYERSQIANQSTLLIDGMEIYIDDHWHGRLDGKTIDFIEGKFVIADHAQ